MIRPRAAGWRGVGAALGLVCALGVGAGCDTTQTTLQGPDCPELPTKFTFADFRAIGYPQGTNPFNAPTSLTAGTITGNVQELPSAGGRDVTHVFAFMDNAATASMGNAVGESAVLRAVIYTVDTAGRPATPLAASAEVDLGTGKDPARWYRFAFADGGVHLAPGSYFIGIWSGGPGVARLYESGAAPLAPSGFVATAAYDPSGLPSSAPSGSTSSTGYALYGLYVDSVEQVNASAFTPAVRAPSTSINLELDQLYMRHRVIDALQAVGIDNPSPDSGVAIDDLRLVQSPDGSPNPNMLVVRITPWLRGAEGKQVSLQRSYRLDLSLTPFLLTPESEPNDDLRHAMLGKDENGQPLDDGIAIRFDLVELHSLTYDEEVKCPSSNFDLIDKNILESLSVSLAAQHPFVVPTKAVTDAISKLGVSTTIDGINLGTDGDFKLGLHVTDTAGKSFEPQTALSRFPSEDWAIDIDPELVKPAIGVMAASGARDLGLSTNGAARVELDSGGVLRIYQSVGGCGDGNIGNVYARVTMSVARVGPGGSPPGTQYVLRAIKEGAADARVKTCAIILGATPFGIADYPRGLATATIGPGGSPPCADAIATIAFQVSPSEWFYATGLDTDGVFYIAGRSSSADSWRGARPEVPSC